MKVEFAERERLAWMRIEYGSAGDHHKNVIVTVCLKPKDADAPGVKKRIEEMWRQMVLDNHEGHDARWRGETSEQSSREP